MKQASHNKTIAPPVSRIAPKANAPRGPIGTVNKFAQMSPKQAAAIALAMKGKAMPGVGARKK